MKRKKGGSSPKQYAYAVKKLNGDGDSKKSIALSVGFSPSVSANAKNKIEKTEGFANAVIELAHKSNNLVLAVMTEYETRGFKNFSNKDLNGAVNAIGMAWERFNKVNAPAGSKALEGNQLRKVIMQRIENQTVNVTATPVPATASEPEPEVPEDDPMDF